MVSVHLAENLKKLRKTAGLSQIEMAKILGRDQATISRLEKGTQSLSIESLFTLARFFELNYEDILNGHINFWELSKKFNTPFKLDPKYLEDNKSVVREIIPFMRFVILKKSAEELKTFLQQFKMVELMYMAPSEPISSLIYFDLLSMAIETNLITQTDVPELVKLTHSTEYHGSFYQVYEKQKNPIDIIKAYCLNSPEYEGAIDNSIISSSDRSITIGFKINEYFKDANLVTANVATFITNFKKLFFSRLPVGFGHNDLLAQNPVNKNKNLNEEVSIKLIYQV